MKNVKVCKSDLFEEKQRLIKWPIWLIEFYYDRIYVIYEFFINFIWKVKKLWFYGKHLWKRDRDFDYVYFLELMDLKLERMKKLFMESKWHEHEDAIKQIEHTQELIALYLEGDHVAVERKELESKYKPIDRWEPIKGSSYFQWNIDYEENGVLHKADSERGKEIAQMYADLVALSMERQREAKEELFAYISDNIENWWD